MFRPIVFAVLLAILPIPAAHADDFAEARQEAARLFQTAQSGLGRSAEGVDVAAYADALLQGSFVSGEGPIRVELVSDADPAGRCDRYAAYVRLPARDGAVTLVLCPRFFAAGADDLRVLTLLHEFVHVVAGADECRAMAFAARVEWLARGSYTPVEAYWQSHGCERSAFRVP